DHGNRNSLSDAGVAALEARAGVDGAVLNVLTNLGSIADDAFKASRREEAVQLRATAERLCDEVLARILTSLAG
ncbi:MAG: cyclodeaminase/cyclohydrolase family protein, partial [Acidobacteriota bacterium]|nr:cyclodeaminase/cyclohydrolase family protein [Acidobacteriota bacterium]